MMFIIFMCGAVFGGLLTAIVMGIVRTVVEIKGEKERLLDITKNDDES